MPPLNSMRKGEGALAADGAERRIAALESQLVELQARLHESEETLQAIRSGDVDAVVVAGEGGQQIYTLTNADRPYRVLIEQMKDGAVTLSPDGITLYCNESFAALVGDPSERIVGTSFVRFIRPEDSAIFGLIFTSGQGGIVELALASPGGIEIPVRLSLSPILNDLEGCIVCAIVADLRERQQLEVLERGHAELGHLVEERTASLLRLVEERRRDEELLRQSEKLQVIGQLTGGIAHDFNNVLHVISGGVTLLKSPRVTPERKAILLDGMERTAQNAAALVARLLAFARRQPLKPAPFDVNERLRGMVELLSRSLGSGVEVKIGLAPDLWPAVADASQFEVAILNLAVNARDAMPSGGTLTLRTHNACMEKAGERLAGDYVCVVIEDTGEGMPASVLARVFEPFFTTKEKDKGTGLGLPQVWGFARQSGGDVEIKSEPGCGTAVTICLPRASDSAMAEEAASEGEASRTAIGRTSGKVVLVVEDNGDVAEIASAMLEGMGYTTRRAGSADEALLLLDSRVAVDVVFSDVMMPGDMTGIELASIMRLRCPHIAVVLATGYSDYLARLEREGSMPAEVLVKPYHLDDLAAAIERALRKASRTVA